MSTGVRVAQMMNTEIREEDDEKTVKGLEYDPKQTFNRMRHSLHLEIEND